MISDLKTLIFPSGTTKCSVCEKRVQTISFLMPPPARGYPQSIVDAQLVGQGLSQPQPTVIDLFFLEFAADQLRQLIGQHRDE